MRLLPDGCVDLVWDGARLVVFGAREASAQVEVRAAARPVGVRLRPGVAGGALGRRADELPAAGIALAELWGARARRWERRLAAADLSGRRELLEGLIATEGRDPDPLVLAAVRLIRSGSSVHGAADAIALSPRALQRRFRAAAGLAPKTFSRVLRLQAFLALLGPLSNGERALAGVAADCGYADQPHLSRECRALTGDTPGGLVTRWSETFKT